MADALSNFLGALRDSQVKQRRSRISAVDDCGSRIEPTEQNAPAAVCGQTVVEYRSDPNHPFTQVTIYGPTADAVQLAITRAMRSVEREGGLATFKGPRRVLGGFGAVGEIIDIPQAAE